jgi:7,8-dihydropterin-6-yl-methyl-4-(beta-D-ribofuranosyl)aminobenzene 5'-phosphate synthase
LPVPPPWTIVCTPSQAASTWSWSSGPEIDRVVSLLHDSLKLERVAPGHCSGELGFAVFLERYKDRFDRAGLGKVILIP